MEKCDEQEPVCRNCKKARRECSGPVTAFANQPQQIVFFKPDNIRWTVPENRRSRAAKPWNQQVEPTVAVSCPSQESISPVMTVSPGFNETENLCTRLAYAIESTKGTAFTLELAGKHVPQLPIRIGSSKVLDSAVACSLAAFTRLQCPHRLTKQYQHKLYIQALSDMRHAVEESSDVDFEAVFAAMTVLGDYEVRPFSRFVFIYCG